MDQSSTIDAAAASTHAEHSPDAAPSLAPPTHSTLSDVPAPAAVDQNTAPAANGESISTEPILPDPSTSQQPSAANPPSQLIQAISDPEAAIGAPGWEAAREQVLKGMTTSADFSPANPPSTRGADTSATKRGGRGSRGRARRGTAAQPGPSSATTPASGRGRGRPGRPRGRGRGRGGPAGRGTKRKRGSGEGEDSDGESEESSDEEFTAVAMTKSGRTVQKPTAFVPPAAPVAAAASTATASPAGGTPLRKRRAYRRNPDAAVCRVCLRGTSPATNMIVFCDGCNTAYHRFCHQPAIDQSVIDEVDKEWYCKQCEQERLLPVPEAEVFDFVSAPGASLEQRQRYFSSLAPGMLVTLLTRATTLHPDLPLFPPGFVSRPAPPLVAGEQGEAKLPINGPTITPRTSKPTMTDEPAAKPQTTEDERVPDDHPPTYPRPGNGLMQSLPSEREDPRWLVDDGDRFGVFTHLYQVDAHAASSGLNGSAVGVVGEAGQ